MSQVPIPSDMNMLRQYVTAKDRYEYHDAHEDTVVLNITHNLLSRRLAELRVSKHMTVLDFKFKVYRHCGTSVDHMKLYVKSNDLSSTPIELSDNSKKLGYYNISSHMTTIHVVDTDPYSLARDGGLEDVSKIKKYEISEEDYEAREKTVRRYKKDQLAKDPNWKPPVLPGNNNTKTKPETNCTNVDHVTLSERCQVSPGDRRGVVMFVGEVPELKKDGLWVGVRFDEPVGRSNGSVSGTSYFTCEEKYGGFVRPGNVQCGAEFPELDDLLLSDDEL